MTISILEARCEELVSWSLKQVRYTSDNSQRTADIRTMCSLSAQLTLSAL
jgi:hypothetical protein